MSNDEYQHIDFWDNLEIEDIKKQKELLFKDLLIFGECIYELKLKLKRIDPRTIDTTKYGENNK